MKSCVELLLRHGATIAEHRTFNEALLDAYAHEDAFQSYACLFTMVTIGMPDVLWVLAQHLAPIPHRTADLLL